MGQGNKKLSKRDPESNLLGYRERGFLPEGLLNYLALLGWAIAEDRDIFSMEEMVAAFDDRPGQPQPGALRPQEGRGDQRHAPAGAARRGPGRSGWCRTSRPPGCCSTEVTDGAARALLGRPPPLVQERMVTLGESVDMLGFLFVDEASFERDPADAAKLLDDRRRTRRSPRPRTTRSRRCRPGTPRAIDEALREALIEGSGSSPATPSAPVRVAVTGRRISPPLFESLELLGRERSLARLASAQQS